MLPSRLPLLRVTPTLHPEPSHRAIDSLMVLVSSIIGIAVIGLYFGSKMPFGSVDVALHYLVVDHYVEWSPIGDPTMQSYPPGAHIVAAALARISSLSPFMAMYEASLGFVFIIYFILYLSLHPAGLLASLIGSAVAAAGVFVLRHSWSIYGFEIVSNFFFAQAAGAAAFLVCLWAAAGSKRSLNDVWIFPFIGFILGWIYPLAQIDWSAGCFVVWIIHIIRLRIGNALTFGYAMGTCILPCLLLTSIFIHPKFYYMLNISFNNGGFNPAIGSLSALRFYNIILACIGLVLLAFAIASYRRSSVFLAAAAMATAICSGMQDMALSLGLGSEYAVRKHTFAILTILIFAVIGLVLETVRYRSPSSFLRGSLPTSAWPVTASAFSVFSIISIVSVYAYDRSSFLDLQNEVRQRHSLRGRTVALDEDLQPEFNYILSLADFRLPIGLAVAQNLGLVTNYAGRLPDYALVSNASAIPKECDIPSETLSRSRLVRFDCEPPLRAGR